MAETSRAAAHPCHRPRSRAACPGDGRPPTRSRPRPASANLRRGRLIWDSGKVALRRPVRRPLRRAAARSRASGSSGSVRVWDADRRPSDWSEPVRPGRWACSQQGDWGAARWIEYPGRTENQPMPIFARQFTRRPAASRSASARLYLSGVGLHLPTLNGRQLTDEVLAPGNSNYQLSSEYRTYDVTDELRSGRQHARRPARQRPRLRAPQRHQPGRRPDRRRTRGGRASSRAAACWSPTPRPAPPTVKLDNVANYHVGGTINVDTGNGGDDLESRTITAIGTAGADGTGITFTPGLSKPHVAGAAVTGSGNNIAATDPSAGAAVTPRLIARLEIALHRRVDATSSSPTAAGAPPSAPLVTDAWYSGADYDARREQAGWDSAGADLSATAKRRDGSAMAWIDAGIAPPPNLATKLVARDAPNRSRSSRRFTPVSVTNPVPGHLGVRLRAEHRRLAAAAPGRRGAGRHDHPDVAGRVARRRRHRRPGLADGRRRPPRHRPVQHLHHGRASAGGETWHPDFNYFGMQWVQVTGLPDGLRADHGPDHGPAAAGRHAGRRCRSPPPTRASTASTRWPGTRSPATSCRCSPTARDARSCPTRPTTRCRWAPSTATTSSAPYLRTTMRHLVEGQSIADTPMAGNVALKTPVYDWGYTGRFGDEINWGNAIILVPALLYELYGDTETMARYYDQMVDFADYIQREKVGTGADAHIVDAALADWVAADQTSGRITGTWGYYMMISKLADDGRADRSPPPTPQRYRALAGDIKAAFNAHFYNSAAAPVHHRRQRRHRRRDPDRPGARARRRARPGHRTRGRPRRPRRARLRLPPDRRRPALQRRHHRHGPDRPGARRRRPRRRPVGPAAGGRPAQLRVLHGADHRQPRRDDHHGRALEPRRLQEPHDPRPDRGVVPRRPGRHPRGRRLHRLPDAGHPAEGRR